MLKKSAFLFLLVAALLIGGCYIAYKNGDRLMAAFKPELEQKVAELLGTQVSFGKIHLQVFPGAAASLRDINIGDKGQKEAFEVGELELKLDLFALLKKKLLIKSLSINDPRITIVKQKDGFKISGLTSGRPLSGENGSGKSGTQSFAVQLDSLGINNGRVVFLDEKREEHLFSGIDFNAGLAFKESGFSIKEPRFSAFYDRSEKIEIEGRGISFSRSRGRLKSDELQVKLPAGSLSVIVDLVPGRNEGTIELRSKSLAVEKILLSLKNSNLLNFPFAGEGTAKASLKVELHGTEPMKIEGGVELSAGEAQVFGNRFSPVSGAVLFEARGKSLLLSTPALLVGYEGRKVGVLEGSFNPLSLKGEIKFRGEKINIGDFKDVLKRFAPNLLKYHLSGEIKPDFKALVKGRDIIVTGKAALQRGDFQYEKFPFKGISGKVGYSYDKNGLALNLKGLTGRVGAGEEMISVSGKILPDKGAVNLNLKSGKLTVANLETLLFKYLPSAKQYLIATGSFAPDIKIKKEGDRLFIDGVIGTEKLSLRSKEIVLSDLSGSVRIKSTGRGGHAVSASGLTGTLGKERVNVGVELLSKGSETVVDSLQIEGMGGDALLTADIKEGRVKAEFKASDIKAERALTALNFSKDSKLQGTVKHFKVKLSGMPGHPETLKGMGRIELTDGLLKGVNIGRAVLTRVDKVPLLSGALYDRIPEEFYPYFEPEDTKINLLKSTFVIEKGEIRSRDLTLVSDLFSVSGKGRVTFGSEINFGSRIYFNKEFSSKFAAKVKEVRPILTREGLLMVPFSMRGILPDVRILPDISELIKYSTQRVIEHKLEDVLGGFLNKDGSGRSSPESGSKAKSPTPPPSPAKKRKAPTLGDLLGGFLGR